MHRAELTVPTQPAFVAGKTVTWCERRASRDLWDLWALNCIGAFRPEVADLYRRFGPTNKLPGELQFADAPTESDRESELCASGPVSCELGGRSAVGSVEVDIGEALIEDALDIGVDRSENLIEERAELQRLRVS